MFDSNSTQVLSNRSEWERVLWLVSDPNATARSFLDETCRLFGPGSAAILWLYDEQYDDLYLDRVSNGSLEPVSDPDLKRRWVAASGELDLGRVIDPKSLPYVRQWCKRANIKLDRVESIEIRGTGQPATRNGVLQVFASHDVDQDQRLVLMSFARALSRTIEARRRERRLSAMRQLREQPDLRRPANDWFDRAAKVTRDVLAAEACLFFRMDPDMRFRCCAADSSSANQIDPATFIAGRNSLTRLVAEAKLTDVRIRDFQNADERTRVFEKDSYDESLVNSVKAVVQSAAVNTVLMMPVVVEGHTFAVAIVVNKTKQLARRFSYTDQLILRAICEFLAGVIPGAENYAAMKQLAELSFDGSLESEETRNQFHQWLAQSIPGLASSALLVTAEHEDAGSAELRQLGGECWFEDPADIDPQSDITTLPPVLVGERIRVASDLPKLSGQRARLILGLERGYISEYERSLIDFACAELSHMLRSEQMVREQKESLVQIRHVVRAGLSGIMSVQVAQSMYDRIVHRNEGELAEFEGARFRRSLETAAEYSRRTNNLLEETRFLLGQITADKLRIGSHSAPEILKDVRRCLAAYADRRRVELIFDNQIPKSTSKFTMDNDLVEIAIFNLLDNAIKYSFREQKVRVTAKLAGNMWLAEFQDFGVFIPPQDRKDIFERFVRKTSVQKQARRRPGTGLGLAVAQEIAEAHGGSVWCDSEPGLKPDDPAETTFYLKMPRSVSSQKRADK